MSIYRRASGRWAVRIDVDAKPFRLLEALPIDRRGSRRTKTIAKYSSAAEAERAKARAIDAGDGRALRVEKTVRGWRNLGTYATKRDAEKAERDALTARDRGIDVEPSNITVAGLLDRYRIAREDLGRELKTTTEYDRLGRLYITPYLGEKLVAKLRPAHVSDWTSTVRRTGGRDGHELSAKTVSHAFRLLSAALRWAVRIELAGRNVCEAVTPPQTVKSNARALEAGEIGKLVETVAGTRWDAYVRLAASTGARRAELLALDWSDVDAEVGTVTISKAMGQTKARVYVKATKTHAVRKVPLSRFALDALRKQRALQAADRLAAVPGNYIEDPLRPIFTNPMGERLTPQAATSAFAKLARKAKISSTRLHDLRHTAGTHLLAAGVDVKTTSEVLGHANPSVTMNVYGHVLEGATRDAVDRLGDRMTRIIDEAAHS